MNINEAADILSIKPDKPKSDLRRKFEADCIDDLTYTGLTLDTIMYNAWLAGYGAGLKVARE